MKYLLILIASTICMVIGHLNSDEIRIKMDNWAMNIQTVVDVRHLIKQQRIFGIKRETPTCTACKANFQTLFDLYRSGSINEEQINIAALPLCALLFGYPEYVCVGLLKLYIPILVYIIKNALKANAGSICGLILQTVNPEDCPFDDDRYDFTIPLPPKLCDYDADRPKCRDNPLTIVHLTDPHIDPEYEPGSISYCDAPLCCRPGVNATPISKPAGYWGDYGTCDSPIWTFNDILHNVIKRTKNIDMVYFTGDIVDHAVWKTTKPSIESEIIYANDRLKETFGNIPLYPCIGNHEGQPQGAFAPQNITDPSLTSSWLYELLIQKWKTWLPPSTFKTIRKGGYYTVLVKPGFRIIALNTNVAYNFNWWIAYNPNDPNGQLKWLVNTLHKAEKAKELVHILSHIPPGSTDIYYQWGVNYDRIIQRFAHIIPAEFDGHMHTDEFKLFYCKNNTEEPCMVAWNGGGMVPYTTFNINFKVFSMDCNKYHTLDYTTYIYNLTEANLTPTRKPRWFKEYSFRDAYGVNSLLPGDIDQLVNQMASDKRLLNKYIEFFGKKGDAYLQTVANGRSELGPIYDFNFLCNMVTTKLGSNEKCEQLLKIFKSSQKEEYNWTQLQYL